MIQAIQNTLRPRLLRDNRVRPMPTNVMKRPDLPPAVDDHEERKPRHLHPEEVPGLGESEPVRNQHPLLREDGALLEVVERLGAVP